MRKGEVVNNRRQTLGGGGSRGCRGCSGGLKGVFIVASSACQPASD